MLIYAFFGKILRKEQIVMKLIKRTAALLLALLMVFSMAGCLHSKDEIAVTIGDVEFTSAQYLYALIQADMAARQTVVDSLGEGITLDNASEIDYYSQKINKKDFVDYVEDEAIKTLKKYAAIITKCKENNIELTDEQQKEVETFVNYYWNSYGYSYMFEPNGVSKDTYTKCVSYDYLSNAYFESIYGKEGSSPVEEKTVNETLLNNFALGNVLAVDLTDMTETEKSSETAKLTDYVARINKGESFLTIYNEYYGSAVAENTEIEKDENGIPTAPADTLATVMGSEETDYASDYYATVNAMKTGAAQLYTSEDGNTIAVLVKKDISADAYYMNTMYIPALYVIKGEEFEDEIDETKKSLETKTKKLVIKRLKVKNIKY